MEFYFDIIEGSCIFCFCSSFIFVGLCDIDLVPRSNNNIAEIPTIFKSTIYKSWSKDRDWFFSFALDARYWDLYMCTYVEEYCTYVTDSLLVCFIRVYGDLIIEI